MEKKKKKCIRNFKEITPFKLFIAILLFPLIVGAIYRLPLPQIICVEAGDLLSFYSVSLGIFSSWLIYWENKKKSEDERYEENRPDFLINVKQATDEPKIFTIKISNQKNTVAKYVYLYGEYVSEQIGKEAKITKTVAFEMTVEELNELKETREIIGICGDDMLDEKDGYPKDVQISCCDKEGNIWGCVYRKINDCGNIYYYPASDSIIS